MTKWTNRFFYAREFIYPSFGQNKPVLLSCCFSMLLLLVRITVTGSFFYAFLLWNLFLAFIPYFITVFLARQALEKDNKIKILFFFFPWLLFIPNSFYIITDLFHLDEGTKAPQWFDLILIFSFAWNGLLAGIISLRQMEKTIRPFLPARWRWLFLQSIFFLNALGIYIGRYLRYNSWDIITSPFRLSRDIISLGIHPLRNVNEWGMIICFTALIIFIYHGFKSIGPEPL